LPWPTCFMSVHLEKGEAPIWGLAMIRSCRPGGDSAWFCPARRSACPPWLPVPSAAHRSFPRHGNGASPRAGYRRQHDSLITFLSGLSQGIRYARRSVSDGHSDHVMYDAGTRLPAGVPRRLRGSACPVAVPPAPTLAWRLARQGQDRSASSEFLASTILGILLWFNKFRGNIPERFSVPVAHDGYL